MGPQAQDGTPDPAGAAPPEPAGWPRPRVTAAACLETGAGWLLLLLAGLASLVVLLLSLQAQEAQAMRDARLAISLHEIASRLEADLALGHALADNTRAQRLLEDAVAHDSTLVSAEVLDPAGVSLFNTDRGSIGEQAPAAWLDAIAAAARGATWIANATGERTIGLPLRGPFGEVAGHVSVSSTPVPTTAPFDFLVLAPLLVMLALVGGWRLLHYALARAVAASDPTAMEAAAARLTATQARLDDTLTVLTSSEADRT